MKIDGRLLDLAGRTAVVIGLDLAHEDMGVVIMSMKRPQDASWGFCLRPIAAHISARNACLPKKMAKRCTKNPAFA